AQMVSAAASAQPPTPIPAPPPPEPVDLDEVWVAEIGTDEPAGDELPADDDAEPDGPSTELVLAEDRAVAMFTAYLRPRAAIAPPRLEPDADQDSEVDADPFAGSGALTPALPDIGPGWITETGNPDESAVPRIRFAELHALWDDEVDLKPVGTPKGPATPLAATTAEIPLAEPISEPSGALALPAAQPAAPAAASTALTGPAATGGLPVPALATTATPATPATPATTATGAGGEPPSADAPAGEQPLTDTAAIRIGARARAKAARRGARRRRVITVVAALLAGLIAVAVPLALRTSNSPGQGTEAGVIVGEPTPAPAEPAQTGAPTEPAGEPVPPPAASAEATADAGATPATTPVVDESGRPGVPGVLLERAAGGVSVRVVAPFNGGPVTSYTVTATPGGTQTLTAPGTLLIPVSGCAETTVTVRAVGPNGTSDPSPPAKEIGCVPPGAPRSVTAAQPAGPNGDVVITWQDPADTGGPGVAPSYVVTVYRLTGDSQVVTDTLTVSGRRYTRGAPSDADPYFQITVAARNPAGTGPAVTAYDVSPRTGGAAQGR
ncbi:MAG: hypothetical protein IRZ08_00610, partial [Frankia sp.]|nr:hypothetical protein [Frankia sp.]